MAMMDLTKIPIKGVTWFEAHFRVPTPRQHVGGAVRPGADINIADVIFEDNSYVQFELVLYQSLHRMARLHIHAHYSPATTRDKKDVWLHAGYLCSRCSQVFMVFEGEKLGDSLGHNCIDRLHGFV